MVEVETKFEPFAVVVKAWPPRVVVMGEIDVREGVGFSCIMVEASPPHPTLTINVSPAVANRITRTMIFMVSGIALSIMTA